MVITKDDIIRMARESLKERDGKDYYDYTHEILHWWGKEDEIVKFAELVAAAEREACAKIADNGADGEDPYCCQPVANCIAKDIRARGSNGL
jgi:hypothetical protein